MNQQPGPAARQSAPHGRSDDPQGLPVIHTQHAGPAEPAPDGSHVQPPGNPQYPSGPVWVDGQIAGEPHDRAAAQQSYPMRAHLDQPAYPMNAHAQQAYPTSGEPWQQGYPPVPGPARVGQPPSGHPWVPSQPAAKPSSLPVEPRYYHDFLRGPAMAWWRPIAAIAMGAALWFIANLAITLVAMAYDLSAGNTTLENYTSLEAFKTTPAFFLANNLALASAIPIAGLTQWACFGQRPRWMSSVTGAFRWSWFGECVAWMLPVFVISMVIDVVVSGPPPIQVTPSTGFMIAAILFTTPLQAAGEEYLLRGLGQRAIAAWFPRTAGLVVSTAVTALIFMWLHGAGDPWLNAFYLMFAVTASVLAWRTGGLEAAIAMHVVNNLVSMTFLPFTDISDMFNREAGTGSAYLLVQMALMLGAAALVLWRAKLRRVVTMAAPAAPVVTPGYPQPMLQQAPPAPQPWRQDNGNQTD